MNPNRTQHFTGDSLSLSCEDQSNSTGWTVRRYTHSERVSDCTQWGSVTGSTCKISPLYPSHTGVYWCESESGENSNPVNITSVRLYRTMMEFRPLSVMLLLISLIPLTPAQGATLLTVGCFIGSAKAVVTIKPDKHVYRGENVTLTCDIQGGGDTEWTYSWYKDNNTFHSERKNKVFTNSTIKWATIRFINDFDSGDYTCRGQRRDSQSSEISDAVTLTVSERPEAVLSVSPQSWLTEGDSVTLSCEVTDSSTGWTFSWHMLIPIKHNDTNKKDKKELFFNNSRGSGGSYTLSPVVLNHAGVYRCKGKRKEQPFQTKYSNQRALLITGKSPPVSLIINPNRTQHFTNDSLSLSCEDQCNSTGWTVRRYKQNNTGSNCSQWGSVTGSTCEISSLSTSYTGVYWCESESGENSNPVNITVHDGNVILESPVHPVTEGRPLTLRCLYRSTKTSNPLADFYKDGSVLQNQTTGEMIIHKVSKSNEGFYHCKHPERGESPKSWVSVREKHQKPNHTSDQKLSRSGAEDSQSGHTPLHAGQTLF
ncbi:Fc receptor-like protein 5 [Clarias gariepinus]|uniref:Fc receptor-like protein 5 n=1 Tax=Clarias gariepinus TaxID=13013 RepID=UPI00234DC208|nr:Fc receptor-like protein 5 [Clarias gariepinus]